MISQNANYGGRTNTRKCSVVDCGNPHAARGYCQAHYRNWSRSGNPIPKITKVAQGEADKLLQELIRRGQKAKVRKEECLTWPFWKRTDGYGGINGYESQIVSRLICIGIYGDPKKDEPDALHNCDRGRFACVEPTHIEWGSKAKNNGPDKRRAGTDLHGEKSPVHKLSDRQVLQIRKLYSSGDWTQRDLASKFACTQATISHIVNNHTRRRPT
jgi:hypothetical protein